MSESVAVTILGQPCFRRDAMVSIVPLSRQLVATVDDADFALASAFKWYAKRHKRSFYAARNVANHTIYLHQMIMPPTPGHVVDHRDGNTLDCRRSNLRLATLQQNAANRRKTRSSTSAYKGVLARKTGFTAIIRVNDRRRNLGFFAVEEAAARAYDAAAIESFGAFASLNFPEGYARS